MQLIRLLSFTISTKETAAAGITIINEIEAKSGNPALCMWRLASVLSCLYVFILFAMPD